jgi:hypothetical protein
LSLLTGWSVTAPAILAAALVVLWNAAIYFDSSALTVGTLASAFVIYYANYALFATHLHAALAQGLLDLKVGKITPPGHCNCEKYKPVYLSAGWLTGN